MAKRLVFGAIADVQYADAEDGSNFAKTARRRYRNALEVLRNAVAAWRRRGESDAGEEEVAFAVQLGDLVDLCNAERSDKARAFEVVLGVLGGLGRPVLHVVGNHDLANFAKPALCSLLGQQETYMSFSPRPGWRCIVLDGYVETVLGEPNASACAAAEAMLDKHNPNKWREKGVDFSAGLEGPQKRFLPYNGALGARQLAWLRGELGQARHNREHVVVFCHLPMLPEAELERNRHLCLLWDYEEALAALDQSGAAVVAVFAGHDHAGGHGVQTTALGRKIHHITLEGAVESEFAECHATVTLTVAEDGATVDIEVAGSGGVASVRARETHAVA